MIHSMYDFETRINRRGTSCAKWDLDKKLTGRSGLLPFWVADMDFEIAPEIKQALHRRLDHGVFGYTERPASLDEALVSWFSRRHSWDIDSADIIEAPGIVPFIHMVIQEFSEEGDAVVIQEPVYYPFRKAIENNGRKVVNNQLVRDAGGRWGMDLTDLETKLDESGAKLMILCSPHNPVGRVWQEEELLALAGICRRHGVLVVSDEIHADLVHSGYTHIPWLSLTGREGGAGDILPLSISLVSATKTFNLPGLTTAYAVANDVELSGRVRRMLAGLGMAGGSTAPLSYIAAEAAWREGEPWLEALMDHLASNDRMLRTRLAESLPEVITADLEGTYLEWLDISGLGLKDEAAWNSLLDAGAWPSRGSQFGRGGEGHLRVNIACPESQLAEGLTMMIRALGF